MLAKKRVTRQQVTLLPLSAVNAEKHATRPYVKPSTVPAAILILTILHQLIVAKR